MSKLDQFYNNHCYKFSNTLWNCLSLTFMIQKQPLAINNSHNIKVIPYGIRQTVILQILNILVKDLKILNSVIPPLPQLIIN